MAGTRTFLIFKELYNQLKNLVEREMVNDKLFL